MNYVPVWHYPRLKPQDEDLNRNQAKIENEPFPCVYMKFEATERFQRLRRYDVARVERLLNGAHDRSLGKNKM